MNLTLIGMSGAGKSFIGKKVAATCGLTFLDIDAEIERELNKSLPLIIDEIGEQKFIQTEADTTISRAHGDGLLISTGGSIIYSPEAMMHLRQVSKVVYLKVPFAVIEERVGASSDRMGRIVGLGSRTLRALYDERVPLYEQYADIAVEVGMHSIDDAVAAVTAAGN